MRVLRWRSIALMGITTFLGLSCADQSSLGDPSTQRLEAGWVSGVVGALISCQPMAADATTQVIGPDGGTLYVGPHRLRVPAGALAAPVTITAVAPSDTVNRVLFSPEGLTFQRPAWLTMSYANCGALRWLTPKRIAYTTDLLEIIDLLLSLDNPLARRVSAEVDHFSTYAVAW